MKKVVIIGAGGVGGVVAHKCAQASDVFGEVLLASRTIEPEDAWNSVSAWLIVLILAMLVASLRMARPQPCLA